MTAAQFHAAEGVEDWRVLYHVVAAHFRTRSFAEGVAFAGEIGRLAGDREPRVELREAGVTVTLTRSDITLARAISQAARRSRLTADPAAVQLVNVTIDALVVAEVLPFWRALLGYHQIGDDYLADPARRGPGVEFQAMAVPRPQRNRLHLDVAVPHDQAGARIAAALAAGGRLVSDEHAPKWWTLADPEGNEACVATWLGRD
ncbi:VOC family protein [Paractinoplanes atraurantiacus]|uniref:4a-hydroxytetrahydrobiopterin dehydratase n=1 Tax=Paractinoplanes atraurantiacus TaxID=1036182 RepID=A0A285FBL4_9ACTN|nr:VOC family protein [Actinoplanes atraurantiacus]SNY08433.1 4a-hydroxytetrahydrobiopterin dehydratase [Actinoplanes atraurantiacus]